MPDDAIPSLRAVQRAIPELRDKITDTELPFCPLCVGNKKHNRLVLTTIPAFPPREEKPPAEVVLIQRGPNNELEIEWWGVARTDLLIPPRGGWRQYTFSLPTN
jgi:hypothetical protein